jgi:subtilase family serine protease
MRDNKQKHKDSQMINNVQNEELEVSQTGYGLESVTEGTDYMAGDEKNSPNCGGL